MEHMTVTAALATLRADVAPSNLRAAAARARDPVELMRLADELEVGGYSVMGAFAVVWALSRVPDAFETACVALATLFGAPTHPAAVSPYVAVLRVAGSLDAVAAAAGGIPDLLEAFLTEGVVRYTNCHEKCRRCGPCGSAVDGRRTRFER